MKDSFVSNEDRIRLYFSVAFGKIVHSLGKTEPENMEGVISRLNKNEVRVYETHHDKIGGHIIGAQLKEPPEDKPDYGKQIALTFLSGSDKAILNIPFDSAYGRGFMYSIEGVDLSLPVTLAPYAYTDKKTGKEKQGLNIYQEGEKVEWTYGTKAKPGGMPELKKVKFKGKDTWDNSEQLVFLEAKFHEFKALVDGIPETEVEVESSMNEQTDY